jgi:hypothetical protein
MAVSVMARCGPGLGAPFSARRAPVQPGVGARAPVSFVRMVRPQMPPSRAFYRSGSCYNNYDEEAMKVCRCCCSRSIVASMSMQPAIHVAWDCCSCKTSFMLKYHVCNVHALLLNDHGVLHGAAAAGRRQCMFCTACMVHAHCLVLRAATH